jgi:hypothetical protein
MNNSKMNNFISETCKNLILVALITLVTMVSAGYITKSILSSYHYTPDYTSSSMPVEEK